MRGPFDPGGSFALLVRVRAGAMDRLSEMASDEHGRIGCVGVDMRMLYLY